MNPRAWHLLFLNQLHLSDDYITIVRRIQSLFCKTFDNAIPQHFTVYVDEEGAAWDYQQIEMHPSLF